METRIGSEMARPFSGVQPTSDESRFIEPSSSTSTSTEEREADRSQSGTGSESRDMDAMVEEVREMARMFERDLEFRIEEDLDQPVVEVRDTQRDEVIRQIPSEQMIELARNMERIQGILFDETT